MLRSHCLWLLLSAACALAAALAPTCARAAVKVPNGPITDWIVLGPFPNPPPADRGPASRGSFDVDYLRPLGGEAAATLTPETVVEVTGAPAARARSVSAPTGRVDLTTLFTETNDRIAYGYTELRGSGGQEALFFVGSDDGAKVWLNGKLMLDVYPTTGRGFVPRQDRFTAPLQKGTNRLLVKVENLSGGWEFGLEAHAGKSARAILNEEERVRRLREFLNQEIGPLQSYPGYVFPVGPLPRIGWRDPEGVRQSAGGIPLKVRWFDADLNEVTRAEKPGRYAAYVEGRLRDGTPLRRSVSVYCTAPDGFQPWMYTWGVEVPYLGKPFDADAWKERAHLTADYAGRLLRQAMASTRDGAVLLAALAEAKPAGRPAGFLDSPDVLDLDYQVALKRKVLGLESVRSLRPPGTRPGGPAPVLREGTPAEAGVAPDARERIEEVCRKWAADSGEPFSILVARRGVIVAHAAFGELEPGRPCTTDFRYEIASITKAISGILFSLFVDQGLVAIDDPIGKHLPDFPTTGPRALTFRHCFTHTSGLEGHGEWGGIWNPHLDNVVLNQLGSLRPGERHIYNGMGYDLAGKALEAITGKSIPRLFTDHLFRPLGFGDVPLADMAFGAQLTAYELGVLGQWLANRGSYGDRQFISPATFEQLLPRPLKEFWPAIDVEWGIGLTHMPERRPGVASSSTDPKDLSLGPKTLGHGSATSCILRVDPEQDLVVAQIRRTAGPRYDLHSRAFFAAIADSIVR